ncbi:protein of unknown function [Aminobacter niigataensis]|nr:protein of unknown function [Aminobacter niigataensis]
MATTQLSEEIGACHLSSHEQVTNLQSMLALRRRIVGWKEPEISNKEAFVKSAFVSAVRTPAGRWLNQWRARQGACRRPQMSYCLHRLTTRIRRSMSTGGR